MTSSRGAWTHLECCNMLHKTLMSYSTMVPNYISIRFEEPFNWRMNLRTDVFVLTVGAVDVSTRTCIVELILKRTWLKDLTMGAQGWGDRKGRIRWKKNSGNWTQSLTWLTQQFNISVKPRSNGPAYKGIWSGTLLSSPQICLLQFSLLAI